MPSLGKVRFVTLQFTELGGDHLETDSCSASVAPSLALELELVDQLATVLQDRLLLFLRGDLATARVSALQQVLVSSTTGTEDSAMMATKTR